MTPVPSELILLPSLKARRGTNGGLILTQKYIDGAAQYAKIWPGPVTSLVRIDTQPGSDMDQVEVPLSGTETPLEERDPDPKRLLKRIQSAAAVLALLSPNEFETAQIGHSHGIPMLFTSEYSPRTERQIVDAGTSNPVLRLRRKLWLRGAEKKRRTILANYAAGLQSSGTPTYDHYAPFADNRLLFFDNRVNADDIIDDQTLNAKCEQVLAGQPLRLVFGGRLIAMKGAMDLVRVAKALLPHDIPWTLEIYGSGPLEGPLRQEIAAGGLSERVFLRAPMDFRTGWIPLLKREADLFICCHPQGDPSSTYPEVMSCGVPIIGYQNEAFEGIVRESGAGWVRPMRDAAGLAEVIARLHANRQEIADMARSGRAFARQHCFEQTFARRTSHLIRASRLPDALKAGH